MTEKPDWKGIALGLGAHLEHLEAHCAVKTGKTGDAHTQEGRLLRQTGRELIATVTEALKADPVGSVSPVFTGPDKNIGPAHWGKTTQGYN